MAHQIVNKWRNLQAAITFRTFAQVAAHIIWHRWDFMKCQMYPTNRTTFAMAKIPCADKISVDWIDLVKFNGMFQFQRANCAISSCVCTNCARLIRTAPLRSAFDNKNRYPIKTNSPFKCHHLIGCRRYFIYLANMMIIFMSNSCHFIQSVNLMQTVVSISKSFVWNSNWNSMRCNIWVSPEESILSLWPILRLLSRKWCKTFSYIFQISSMGNSRARTLKNHQILIWNITKEFFR